MGEAEAALAFVCRREGKRAMPRARWEHVLSLDLGWMTPAQARAYVERAHAAGLLVEEGDEWKFSADLATIEVPRRFRPNPEGRDLLPPTASARLDDAPLASPRPADAPLASRQPATSPTAQGAAPPAAESPAVRPQPARADPATAPPPRPQAAGAPATHARPGTGQAAPGDATAAAFDGFLAWVDRVAQATRQSREQVLAAVAARQEAVGGFLTAEAAVLWLASQAGLPDVPLAARASEQRLRQGRG